MTSAAPTPSARSASLRLLHWLCVCSLILLILLDTAWELWLAPLRAGGSLLVLKVLPLLLPLFGILRERLYTYQYACMLILFYFTEGVVRAWSDKGLSARLALTEVLLTVLFYAACLFFVRGAKQNGRRTGT